MSAHSLFRVSQFFSAVKALRGKFATAQVGASIAAEYSVGGVVGGQNVSGSLSAQEVDAFINECDLLWEGRDYLQTAAGTSLTLAQKKVAQVERSIAAGDFDPVTSRLLLKETLILLRVVQHQKALDRQKK